MAIWPNIERVLGRISAEAVISGPGMLRLYRAICRTDGVEPRHATQEAVTAAGLAGSDAKAAETLTLFGTYLGRVAGDLALIFMAYGGVFLGGGIAAKIAPVLKAGEFRKAFTAKAPHEALLERMATAIIIKEDAALAGIAAFARAPTRFGVELGGRRWRGRLLASRSALRASSPLVAFPVGASRLLASCYFSSSALAGSALSWL